MIAALEVLSPGMLTTVQDLGRYGHQAEGVPVSGAMDPFALQVGNLLLGNEPGAAGLEIALQGPSFRALRDLHVCVCGADFGAARAVAGQPGAAPRGAAVPLWQSFVLGAGEVITFGKRHTGMWAYLCLDGGIDVPLVLGSRSTFLRGALGGLEGRRLRTGDILGTGAGSGRGTSRPSASFDAAPAPGAVSGVRAVPGPDNSLFDVATMESFFAGEFTVTPLSDRMGYRLSGPVLRAKTGAEMLSAGTAPGLVQVPPDGQPIVLMADRQTTGGYPRIATVISVDVGLLAQAAPGDVVRFLRTTVEDAQDAAVRQAGILAALARREGL